MCSTETIYDFSLNTIVLLHQNLLICVQLIYSLMQNRVTHCPEGQKKNWTKKLKWNNITVQFAWNVRGQQLYIAQVSDFSSKHNTNYAVQVSPDMRF